MSKKITSLFKLQEVAEIFFCSDVTNRHSSGGGFDFSHRDFI